MNKVSINTANFLQEVDNLDFHDAALKDLYCNYEQHEVFGERIVGCHEC